MDSKWNQSQIAVKAFTSWIFCTYRYQRFWARNFKNNDYSDYFLENSSLESIFVHKRMRNFKFHILHLAKWSRTALSSEVVSVVKRFRRILGNYSFKILIICWDFSSGFYILGSSVWSLREDKLSSFGT